MKTIRVPRLKTSCKDKATELEGSITHWGCDMSGHIRYLFQPRGLDNKTQQPLRSVSLEIERLEGIEKDDYEDFELPFDMLGTQVEDEASGFKGMAISFLCHPNGCLHVEVQPSGMLEDTGQAIRSGDFDMRQLSGKMVPKMTGEEEKESKKKKPSPAPASSEMFKL